MASVFRTKRKDGKYHRNSFYKSQPVQVSPPKEKSSSESD